MGRASEAELREALEAVALEGEWRLGMGIDPDWGLLNAAIDELVRLREKVERLRAIEAALCRLTRVGGEFSANMAGPHWEELCAALSEARAALRS